MTRDRYTITTVVGVLLLAGFSGCASYKQNIMFKPTEGVDYSKPLAGTGEFYVEPGDQLNVDVYTNDGEFLIDPNRELNSQSTVSANIKPVYAVTDDGQLHLPMVGNLQVLGYSQRQLEDSIAHRFSRFYESPFVKLTFLNKRVSVLGATGGFVVPLAQENMRLTEVLALAKGLPADSKATNIRVLRGEQIFVADLSTTDGYLKNNILVAPNDIIYVEPVRRPASEATRDIVPLVSVITGLAALLVILLR